MVLNYVFGHPAIATVCALLAAALAFLRHRKFPRWLPAAAESGVALAMTIFLLYTIVHFEAPTVQLRGWLIASDLESPLDKAICDLSPSRDGCAKPGSKAAAPGVTRVGSYARADQDLDLTNVDNPGILLLESSSTQAGLLLKDYHFTNPLQPEAALKLLYDKYACLVVASLLSLLFLSFLTRPAELPVWSDVLTVTRTALVIVSAVSSLMIPYVYGKLVDPALLPNAFLQFLQDRPTVMSNLGQEVVGGDPFEQGGSFPVVSQTDKSLSVLSIQRGTGITKLIEIPREKIVSIDYAADVDVLAKISECQKGEVGQCQQ
jgi:hypothetical protein